MEAPLGVTFFKKVELYQKISDLDQQTKKMSTKGGIESFWPLEKKVLAWAHVGHKHLGSPIRTDDFSQGSSDNKLADFEIEAEEVKDINLTRLLDNFIAHGFATEILEGRLYSGRTPNENLMYLSREGMMVGEILNEIKNPIYHLSYWFWGKLWGHLGGFILIIVLLIVLFNLLEPLLRLVIQSVS